MSSVIVIAVTLSNAAETAAAVTLRGGEAAAKLVVGAAPTNDTAAAWHYVPKLGYYRTGAASGEPGRKETATRVGIEAPNAWRPAFERPLFRRKTTR